MGWNTVVFILNDMMESIERSPKTVICALTTPIMGIPDERDEQRRRELLHSVGVENGEPWLNPQALEVLPTFHADERRFYVAGRNMIEQLTPVRVTKSKAGKKLITLELPDHWEWR